MERDNTKPTTPRPSPTGHAHSQTKLEAWPALSPTEKLSTIQRLKLSTPEEDDLWLLFRALRDEQKEIRDAALSLMQQIEGELHTTKTPPPLRKHTPPTDEHTSQTSLDTLETPQIAPNDLLVEIFSRLRDKEPKKDDDAIEEIVYSLGRLGQKSGDIVNELTELLQNELEQDFIRGKAARALSYVGTPEVTPVLLQALKSKSSGVRAEVAASLRFLKDPGPEVIQALIQALEDERAWVRSNAARALGDLAERAQEATPSLLQALYDIEHLVRKNAAWALGKIPLCKQTQPFLPEILFALDLLLRDTDESVCKNAAWALGCIGPHAASNVSGLTEALKSHFDGLRLNAALALGQIGPNAKVALPQLLSVLHDPNTKVRANAIWAIGRIKENSPTVQDALKKCLQSEKTLLRMEAATALIRLSAGELLPTLAVLATLAFHVEQFKQHMEKNDSMLASISAEDLAAASQLLHNKTALLLKPLQNTHELNIQKEARSQILNEIQQLTQQILTVWKKFLKESNGKSPAEADSTTQHLEELHQLLLEDVLSRWHDAFEQRLFEEEP